MSQLVRETDAGTGHDSFFSSEERGAVSRGCPIPLYRQLFELLKNRILSGRDGFGQLLPGEIKIASAFKVSRITVEKALRMLCNEGLIERKPGIGSYVTYERDSANPGKGFDVTTAGQKSRETSGSYETVLKAETVLVSSDANCSYFDPTVFHSALYVARAQYDSKGRPAAFLESWSCGLDPAAENAVLTGGLRIEVLERSGFELSHATQTVTAGTVSAHAERILVVPSGSPVLRLFRLAYDRQGRTVDVLQAQYRSDAAEITVSLDRSEILYPDQYPDPLGSLVS